MSNARNSTDNVLEAIEALLGAVRHENQKWVEINKAGTILYKLRSEEDTPSEGGGWLEGILNAIDIESGPIGGTKRPPGKGGVTPVNGGTPIPPVRADTAAEAGADGPAPAEASPALVQSVVEAIVALLNVVQKKNDKWAEISRAEVLLYQLSATRDARAVRMASAG